MKKVRNLVKTKINSSLHEEVLRSLVWSGILYLFKLQNEIWKKAIGRLERMGGEGKGCERRQG